MFVLSVEVCACIWEGRQNETEGTRVIGEELIVKELPGAGKLEDGRM